MAPVLLNLMLCVVSVKCLATVDHQCSCLMTDVFRYYSGDVIACVSGVHSATGAGVLGTAGLLCQHVFQASFYVGFIKF
jgi:hypothetical protein